MTKEVRYGTIIFAMLIGLIVGFTVVVILDSYTSRKRKGIYAVIIAMNFVLVMQNLIEYYLASYTNEIVWRTFFAVLGYSVRPAILALFAYLFSSKKKHVSAWCLVGVNAILHSTAFYSHLVFWIDDNNSYQGGPLHYLCLIISLILLAYLIFLAFLRYRKERIDTKEIIFHFFWIMIIIAGIVADILWNFDQWIDYVTISVVIACVFTYIWFHQRFVADYEAAFLAEQRFNMMLSQIRPHFIYNSLSAIAEIEGVPEKAQKAIVDFSDYLRKNLDAMTTEALVSFDKELEHIKKYIDLEILRFGEKVKVVFDLRFTDFMLPALTVQMLVENAVKHGITEKYEGGTVTISSKKDDGNVVVTVSDDGVGFDTEKEIADNHIGINNVRKRLEYSVGGTLDIVSEVGKGTTATIVIPYVQKVKKS